MATKAKAEPVVAPPAPEPEAPNPLRAVLDAVWAGERAINEDGVYTGLAAMTAEQFGALKKFAKANPPDHLSPEDTVMELSQIQRQTGIRLTDG